MSSLYADYLLERRGLSVLEDEYGRGFCSYVIESGKHVYIQDVYVQKGYRNLALASEMADQVAELARAQGCALMLGSVDPTLPSATTSLAVLLAYGFRLLEVSSSRIILQKDI